MQFTLHVFIFHGILTMLIVFLPTYSPNTESPFHDINKLIKKYAFCITLFIRTFYNQSVDVILFEYMLYYAIIRVGILRFLSRLLMLNGFSREFNTSGHLFLFSYSCYIFLRCLLLYDSSINVICAMIFLLYLLLGVRTVVYYHKKLECLLSMFVSLFICLLHNWTIEK